MWLPCREASASQARVLLRTLLAQLESPELDWCNAELVASELVTNAVIHGSGRSGGLIFVRFEGSVEQLRIEVHDSSRALPTVQSASLDDEGGRGLHLVELLGAAWGSEGSDVGLSKRVWAIVRPDRNVP
ncbi:anti-sigma regulatory factor (Ser/Thr protein kinase) [Kitasatospora viridis]|uniref:Anti-sigma regulatory factor (Ser/Thr protein kinase) n=1 Tax=Kitasatospora viridis TaxID=281105 RepID=A0A561TTH0_9ACTN|nr:anti-sigma regulatory factor (Ser/Thr protein kinase) [Kitasatospora viridis]